VIGRRRRRCEYFGGRWGGGFGGLDEGDHAGLRFVGTARRLASSICVNIT